MKNYFTTISVFSILLISGFAQSEVLVVDPSGGGDFPSFEEAILEAVDGDIIEFVDGAHYVNFLSIVENLTFRSASGDPNSCYILGEEENSNLQFGDFENDTYSEILNLGLLTPQLKLFSSETLIRGCRISSEIISWGSVLEFENTIFQNVPSFSSWGSENGTSFRSCQFLNSPINAGGPYDPQDGSIVFEECLFSGQGGMHIFTASPIIFDRCTMTELEDSSIILVATNSVMVTSCLFSDNLAGSGGVLQISGHGWHGGPSEVDILDCTFRNNTSPGETAGLRSWAAEPGLPFICDNVDFVDNSAPAGAADVWIVGGGTIIMNCCLIDEANIGGSGIVEITFDGCTVANEQLSFGALKALFK